MRNIIFKATLKNSVICILSVLALFVITGCAAPKINPVLAKAQAYYQTAKDNPDIEKNAAVALYEAEKSLDKAAKAEEIDEIEREANRAYRQVQIAVAQAEKKLAEKKIDLLTKENETLIIERSRRQADLRAAEAEQALRLAEQKVKEANQSKTQAEQSRIQAEQARTQAEQARIKAEQMKKEAEEKAAEAEKARLKVAQAEEDLAKLQKDFEELQAKQTDRGIVLTLGDVLFESRKAELQPGAVRNIQKVAEFILQNQNRNILVEGHTDSRGSDDYNLQLSERRADSVRRALINNGVPPERITIKGYGERFPIAGNDTESGRQQNRRVEIVILNEGVKAESLFR